jgi:serine/threonine protein kinase
MKPIPIRSYAGHFMLDGITYYIKYIDSYTNGVNAFVVKCNFMCVDGLIDDNKIISSKKLFLYKRFFDKNNYIKEKITVNNITTKFNNFNYDFYHKIVYYDDLNNVLIYDYLGETLNENFDLKSFDLISKLKIFKSIVEFCIVLKNYDILHNDIKPDNIVINNNYNVGLLVDYGNTLDHHSLKFGNFFDTTIWSASPEYYIINEMMDNNTYDYDDKNTKSMIFKSQIFPLAGILIGLVKNDINYYFKTFYKYIYIDKKDDENMSNRFSNFNVSKNNKLVDGITQILNTMSKILVNDFRNIYNLIEKMLTIDFTDRISLEDISLELDNIINSKIDQIEAL